MASKLVAIDFEYKPLNQNLHIHFISTDAKGHSIVLEPTYNG